MTEPEARAGWGIAAAWGAAIAVWVAVVLLAGAALPWQWREWRENVENWPPAIAESRERGETEMAARQQAWMERDQRAGLFTVGTLGAVLLLALAAPFAVRKLVPRRRRAGWRGLLLAVPALALLALAGYLALASLLRGSIKG